MNRDKALYANMQKAAQLINDEGILELVASLSKFVGTDDGTEIHKHSLDHSQTISKFAKSKFMVEAVGSKKRYRAERLPYLQLLAMCRNLYPYCNEDGDLVINAILSRLRELV